MEFHFVHLQDIDLPDIKKVNEEENLVRRIVKFENYWKVSPYYLEENTSKKTQSIGIERFSDKTKPKATITRDSLLQILELQKFPLELTSGSKGLQRQSIRKKVRWNPDIGLQNMFEKYERGEGAKKEGDNEEEEEEEEEEVEEEEEEEEDLSDDDYNQVQISFLWYLQYLVLIRGILKLLNLQRSFMVVVFNVADEPTY
ncbi:hypothetical protein FEM48_Zijuj09G0187700 [Ziziphus jujuba var. spinosa]|uniref:Uncharacterized protein n=1 Tax=Ziziphus jujuba var. spinosa TaxID=714518 RepID=A0A978UUP2_ZIZJJ|nr:hypothetical protein FEM48_Zijuj09G0187700 [Ziziphus jujuba var. spinosa]